MTAELLSVPQAAALLGLTRATLNAAIRWGTLPATKIGRNWIVARADVLAYGARRGDRLGHKGPTPGRTWRQRSSGAARP